MNEQPDQSFPKQHRLLTREAFDRVFAVKCSASDGRIILYGAASELDHPRIGLVVSKKIGNAVVRNQWKRLLREAFRLSRDELPTHLDIVVLPKQGVTPELASFQRSLVELSRRVAKRARPNLAVVPPEP